MQEVSRNWCWIVDTAGSITRGTRKQKVAALEVIIGQLVVQGDKVVSTIDKVDRTTKILAFSALPEYGHEREGESGEVDGGLLDDVSQVAQPPPHLLLAEPQHLVRRCAVSLQPRPD